MTSKLVLARDLVPASVNAISSTGLGVSYYITSAILSGGGQSLTFNSVKDTDMVFIATSMSFVSITNTNMPNAGNMTWTFNTSDGLKINIGGPPMVFPASGGSITINFTYNRSWNRGAFIDFTRNVNFSLSMSPSPTATNFGSASNTLTLNYSSTNPNVSASNTYANGVPTTGLVGRVSDFTIVSCNSSGVPLTAGGAVFFLLVVGPGGVGSTSFWVQDNQDGTYTASFIPKVTGNHDVYVTYLGTSISKFPVTVSVS